MKLLPTKYYAFGLINAMIKIGFVIAFCSVFAGGIALIIWLWFFHTPIALLLVLIAIIGMVTVREAAKAYANGMKVSKPWEEKATDTGPR